MINYISTQHIQSSIKHNNLDANTVFKKEKNHSLRIDSIEYIFNFFTHNNYFYISKCRLYNLIYDTVNNKLEQRIVRR